MKLWFRELMRKIRICVTAFLVLGLIAVFIYPAYCAVESPVLFIFNDVNWNTKLLRY